MIHVLFMVCLPIIIAIGIMDYTGRAFPLRLGNHEIGICPWVPFGSNGFMEQMPGPALVDYSDGSCQLRQITRVGCFYWASVTIPVGYG